MAIFINKKIIFLTFLALYCFGLLAGPDDFDDEIIFGILKEAGAATYSYKPDYSKNTAHMYLGYDKEGNVLIGIADRKYKTYEKVSTLITIIKEGNSYIVSDVLVGDIDIIKDDKKKDKVLSALKDILGTILIDPEGQEQSIDAVSGATELYSGLYLNYDFLSKNIIETMKKNPDWPRNALPVNQDKQK